MSDMTKRQKEIARKLGYQSLFADRDTMQEAYEYAEIVAKATGEQSAVLTAVFVYSNTLAKLISAQLGAFESEDLDIINVLDCVKDAMEHNYVDNEVSIKDLMGIIQKLEVRHE